MRPIDEPQGEAHGGPMSAAAAPVRRPGRAALCVLGLWLLGCEEGGEEVWEGEYVAYSWSGDLRPCAGTFVHMDGYVPFLRERLQVERSTGELLSYTWMKEADFKERFGDALGRAVRGRSYAWFPTVVHELAHAVDYFDLRGGPKRRDWSSFLTEGLATVYEDVNLRHGRRFVQIDPRPYLEDYGQDEGVTYDSYVPVAAAFVSYLVVRFGVERFQALHQGMFRRSSDRRFERVFEGVYGTELGIVVEEYLRARECEPPLEGDPFDYACSAPELERRDGEWRLEAALDCEDPAVVGGVWVEEGAAVGWIHRSVTLSLADATGVTVTLSGSGAAEVFVMVGPCGACPWLYEDHVVTHWRPRELKLPAGRTSITLFSRSAGAPEVVVSVVDSEPGS